MIDLHTLLADAPLPDPTTLSSPSNVEVDPLIDRGGQITVYVGAFLVIFGIAAVVGFFSRRIEHALITAFSLSLCFVIFLAFSH